MHALRKSLDLQVETNAIRRRRGDMAESFAEIQREQHGGPSPRADGGVTELDLGEGLPRDAGALGDDLHREPSAAAGGTNVGAEV